MGKIVFILGGARSGKSTYAVELAKNHNERIAFIATCRPKDEEMKKRIELHKKKRPVHWKTFEEPKNVSSLLKEITAGFDTVIIDCLTLLVSNLLSDNLDDRIIEQRIKKMLKTLEKANCRSIIVSNEVGLGIVPGNKLARRFRDLAGRINQLVVKKADEVFFMISGLPLKLKGVKNE